jgi:hypothetical protein
MLQMNLIRQEELYKGLYREVCDELWGELNRELYRQYWELYGEVYQPLGSQILTDFSHSKISRV